MKIEKGESSRKQAFLVRGIQDKEKKDVEKTGSGEKYQEKCNDLAGPVIYMFLTFKICFSTEIRRKIRNIL